MRKKSSLTCVSHGLKYGGTYFRSYFRKWAVRGGNRLEEGLNYRVYATQTRTYFDQIYLFIIGSRKIMKKIQCNWLYLTVKQLNGSSENSMFVIVFYSLLLKSLYFFGRLQKQSRWGWNQHLVVSVVTILGWSPEPHLFDMWRTIDPRLISEEQHTETIVLIIAQYGTFFLYHSKVSRWREEGSGSYSEATIRVILVTRPPNHDD